VIAGGTTPAVLRAALAIAEALARVSLLATASAVLGLLAIGRRLGGRLSRGGSGFDGALGGGGSL